MQTEHGTKLHPGEFGGVLVTFGTSQLGFVLFGVSVPSGEAKSLL